MDRARLVRLGEIALKLAEQIRSGKGKDHAAEVTAEVQGLRAALFLGEGLDPEVRDMLAPVSLGRLGEALPKLRLDPFYAFSASGRLAVPEALEEVAGALKQAAEQVGRGASPGQATASLGDGDEGGDEGEARERGGDIPRGWHFIRKLSAGGQGTVTLVERRGQRPARGVLKQLDGRGLSDPKKRTRLLREIATLDRLRHPNIVPVLGAILRGDRPWMITEYAPQGSAHDNRELFKGDWWRTFRLARDVAMALGVAHANKIVHRDVKPKNILVKDSNWFLLADFGIAHLPDETMVTGTNERVGSHDFSPPEADEKGLEPTAAFDVYSLGKVIYYLLAGSLLRRERFADPEFEVGEVLGRPDLHVVTERVLSRLIAEAPSNRVQTMAGVVQVLDSAMAAWLVRQVPGLAVASLPATEAKGTVGPEAGRPKGSRPSDGKFVGVVEALEKALHQHQYQWTLEKARGKARSDKQARATLSALARAIEPLRLECSDWLSPSVLNIADDAMVEARNLDAFEIYMDGGKTEEEFFTRGDRLLLKVRDFAALARREAEGGGGGGGM